MTKASEFEIKVGMTVVIKKSVFPKNEREENQTVESRLFAIDRITLNMDNGKAMIVGTWVTPRIVGRPVFYFGDINISETIKYNETGNE